jgi:hypothetical protein
MEIKFETRHLDEKLYERMILHYIYNHYYYKDYARYMEQDKWRIQIISTKDFDRSFYNGVPNDQLDYSIPHGVTGKGDVICYVTDTTNPLIMLQNMSVICHELAHMILMVYYPNKLTTQRYDDFYGKAGDQRKFFSSEVHDRVAEGQVKQFKIKTGWRKQVSFIGVDISSLTNSRSEEKDLGISSS